MFARWASLTTGLAIVFLAAPQNLRAQNPPIIIKAFGAASIPLTGTTSLTFTIQNNNAATILHGVGFTDTFPAGLVVATPNGLSGSCGGGTITAVAGSGNVSLSGATLASSSSCSFSINVTGTTAGTKSNTTGQVTSTEGGTGGTATAFVNVDGPPTIVKSFNPNPILVGGTTSLTFTLTNPAANPDASTGVAFTDVLPSGLTVPNASATVCGGTVTLTAPNTITMTGATIATNNQCVFSITVTGAAAGSYTNTTSAISSTNGGTGNTASANLTVSANPPVIIKAFGAASVPLTGSTSLTFTIQNNNASTTLHGIGFTDSLPAGLTVSTPNGLSGSCGGGTITAIAGSGNVSLSGATIASSSSCSFSINVTGTTAGSETNTTGQVTSTEGGTGGTATAFLHVEGPPTITKSFNPNPINVSGTTSLTFTLTNPAANPDALTGVAFTDVLPSGLTVPNASATVCGGTVTLTAPNTITMTGATIATNNQCVFSITVTGAAPGSYTNTTSAVSSTNGGTGNTASANLTVSLLPPVIIKAFGAASVPLNGSTSLTFTIQNNNPGTTLHGVGFTDSLPPGLTVATPNGLLGSCGGGTITATAGGGNVSLSAATLVSSSSCTFSINVTGVAAGTQNNTTSQVTATESGNGGTASAGVTVVAPPSITKSFSPSPIAQNGTTSLTFTVTNPAANTVSLTGVAFTDTLPAGLTVPNASATVCGGTVTLTAPNQISLTGATIAANTQCQFSVTVTGAALGQFINTTGAVTSTNGGTGNTATANLTVGTPPTITKAFGGSTAALNTNTALTFTITNPNSSGITGVAFTDALPSGLVVSTPNGLNNLCGGSVAATAGTGSIVLSSGTVAGNTSCTIVVNVKGTTAGAKNNITTAVTSNETGPGNTAAASITILASPVITTSFGANSLLLTGTTTLSFTITNPNASNPLTGIAFSDTLPAGLIITTPNGLTGSCGGGTISATANGTLVSLSGATLAGGASCTFSLNVTATQSGVQNNSTGAVSSTNGGPGAAASASLTVLTTVTPAPPTLLLLLISLPLLFWLGRRLNQRRGGSPIALV